MGDDENQRSRSFRETAKDLTGSKQKQIKGGLGRGLAGDKPPIAEAPPACQLIFRDGPFVERLCDRQKASRVTRLLAGAVDDTTRELSE